MKSAGVKECSGQHPQAGFSLLELMVSITIGAILMTGMVAMFNSSGETRRELEKTGSLIENGRYAIGLLYDDLRHAGFYGQFYDTGDAPATEPDPCETANLGTLKTHIAMPIQGYRAATSSTQAPIVAASTCDEDGVLPASNFVAGSDILVVRRADTEVFTGNPTAGRIYLQANARDLNLLLGNSGANVPTATADNNATASLKKYPSKGTATPADTRLYRVHVYFVAPCSYGSGANDTCTAADDDVPTLKRLELSASGGATAMTISSLVEGVQRMKVEYGMDTVPNTVNLTTLLIGDGMPDNYVTAPALADWPGVVSVRVNLLLRSTQATQDYTDSKQYNLGGVLAGPFGDKFRRRVYSTEVMPVNIAGRREIPY
ncbi:MAG: PilW family protein [Gammaproteobacteria bacterium]|nr:PilW family protein [Gammaproteobacteria bacterium]